MAVLGPTGLVDSSYAVRGRAAQASTKAARCRAVERRTIGASSPDRSL